MVESQAPTTGHSIFKSLTMRVAAVAVAMMLIVLAVFSSVFVLTERQRAKEDILANGKTFAIFSAQNTYNDYKQFYTHPRPEDFSNFKKHVTATLSYNKDVQNMSLLS